MRRGFASIADIPSPERPFRISRSPLFVQRGKDSAEAAARHYGVPIPFAMPRSSLNIPPSIWSEPALKCPITTSRVTTAIEAGNHVYCEWPLGRNTGEAVRML